MVKPQAIGWPPPLTKIPDCFAAVIILPISLPETDLPEPFDS